MRLWIARTATNSLRAQGEGEQYFVPDRKIQAAIEQAAFFISVF